MKNINEFYQSASDELDKSIHEIITFYLSNGLLVKKSPTFHLPAPVTEFKLHSLEFFYKYLFLIDIFVIQTYNNFQDYRTFVCFSIFS